MTNGSNLGDLADAIAKAREIDPDFGKTPEKSKEEANKED